MICLFFSYLHFIPPCVVTQQVILHIYGQQKAPRSVSLARREQDHRAGVSYCWLLLTILPVCGTKAIHALTKNQ